MADYVKSTQEQATAAWVDYLNQLRWNTFLENLSAQDINLNHSLSALCEAKLTIAKEIVEKNRGGIKGMHGYIAEAAEVGIGNAYKLVTGENPEYIWVNNNGPINMFRNGVPIQQKFSEAGGHFGLEQIKEHLSTYPNFLDSGGVYQIPKDYYEKLSKLLSMSQTEAAKLSKSGSESGLTYSNWKWVHKFFEENNIDINNIKPSYLKYSESKNGQYQKALKKVTKKIHEIDSQNREQYYQESMPTVQEGMQITAISSAMEGGVAFCLAVVKKRKGGKKISEFTSDDWKDVGIDTSKGVFQGGIRGATVYTLSNFTATPANVATSLVTATFGVTAQAKLLHEGRIDDEEFLINSEALCLDVTISAVSSLLGQVAIPVPVLGAIIGNVAGMFLYDIAKNQGLEREQSLIAGYRAEITALIERLDEQNRALLRLLEANLTKFKSMLELAFDPDINTAFDSSIEFARFNGVAEEKILKTKSDIDAFFLARNKRRLSL